MPADDRPPAKGLEIRPPERADVRAVASLHFHSWLATYAPLLRADEVARLTLAERLSSWEHLLEGRPATMGALVAVRSGVIVGLVQWETGIEVDPPTGEVHAIHIVAREQGRGVGRQLLAAAVSAMRERGQQQAILWVLQDNTTARAFYEAEGWAWDGTRLERPLGGFAGFPMVLEVRYHLAL